jgi:hypothetical protein
MDKNPPRAIVGRVALFINAIQTAHLVTKSVRKNPGEMFIPQNVS